MKFSRVGLDKGWDESTRPKPKSI